MNAAFSQNIWDLRANGKPFSTTDRNNDVYYPCATGTGGWWFGWCSTSALTSVEAAAYWTISANPIRDVVSSRMMIRAI